MEPESRWLKELKTLDRHLFYSWDHSRERWCVCRADPELKDNGTPVIYKIMFIEEDDGSFRPFDHRVIRKLRRNDMQRFASTKAATDSMLNDQIKQEDSIHRAADNELEAKSKYYARAIYRALQELRQ